MKNISEHIHRYRKESKIRKLPSKIIHEKDSIPQSTFYDQFSHYLELQKGRENEVLHVRMVCPGKICQLYRTSETFDNVPCSSMIKCCQYITASCFGVAKTKKYTVLWIEAEDISEICISSSMMVDHFPYNVSRALQAAAESVGAFDIRTDEIDSNDEVTHEAEKKTS